MSLITIKRAGIVGFAVALTAALVLAGLSENVSNNRSAAQDKTPADEMNRLKTENSDAFRETMNSRTISTLLANQEINFSETNLLPSRVEGSRTIHVSFKPVDKNSSGNEFSTEKSSANLLKQTSSRTSDKPLSRQRSFELAPSQILIVSIDANKQTLWWDLQTDPRFFKAETADDNGVLSGSTVYRNDADMLVNFPAAKEITELYFYSPNWDGKTYSLELIGKLNVNNQAQPE